MSLDTGPFQGLPGDLRRFNTYVREDSGVIDHISETRSCIVLAAAGSTARIVQKPVSVFVLCAFQPLTANTACRPIEASVSLLPLFEFLFFNPLFTQVFTDTTHSDNGETTTSRIPPLSYTVLSLSSYLLTHGTSSASPRAMAYANLAMNVLLIMAENSRVMDMFCSQSVQPIRLCRQVCFFKDRLGLFNMCFWM